LSLPIGTTVVFGVLGFSYCASFLIAFFSNDEHSPVLRWSLFLFLRSADLASGVSPIVPILLVGVAALALLICSLRRISLLEENRTIASSLSFDTKNKSEDTHSFDGVTEVEERIRRLLIARRETCRLRSFFL
jgi:hypothetical protein